MWAEFNEKQYEIGFAKEISTQYEVWWTPSQHQEHWLGFDAAYSSDDLRIFQILQGGNIPHGIQLDRIFASEMDNVFPGTYFNLFVQHKRPEFIKSPRGKERAYWQKSYYRFNIDSQQQKLLEKLENSSSSNAVVTYACAAFYRRADLYRHLNNKSLIQSSNFVRPSRLTGHDRYTFDKPGSCGQAFSQHEFIEDSALSERIAERISEGGQPLSTLIGLAARAATETMATDDVLYDLFQQIIEICHTIVVDDVLWDKMFAQLNRPEHYYPQPGPSLLRAFLNALQIDGKIVGLGHTSSPFDEELDIPSGSQDDTYLVRLAVETGAILVTTDAPLRQDLESSGIRSDYSLMVVPPEEALGLL